MKNILSIIFLMSIISMISQTKESLIRKGLYRANIESISPKKVNTTTTLGQRNDSINRWYWDTVTVGWKNIPHEKKVNLIYDANDNILSFDVQSWNGLNWVNSRKEISTFNSLNLPFIINFTCFSKNSVSTNIISRIQLKLILY